MEVVENLAGFLNRNFIIRLISALVLAPAFIFLAWLGGWWFALILFFMAVLMYWEWVLMTLKRIHIVRDASAILMSAALTLLMILYPTFYLIELSWALILLGACFVFFFGFKIGWNIAGIGVASSLALCLIYIRQIEPEGDRGFYLLIFMCSSVWAADVFAYLIGRSIGGPKLMPKISPKKTWSGFFGGITGALLIGGGLAFLLFENELERFLFIAFFLSLTAQIGDLIESSVKRRFNVKDASNIIPGHGGVLDRVDGLSLATYAFTAFYAAGFLHVQ